MTHHSNRFLRLPLLALLTAIALPAYAEWYIGVGMGSTDAGDYKDMTQFTGSVDEKSTSKDILVGYQFHKYGAIEAGYSDLGEVTFNGDWLGTSDLGTIKTSGTKVAVLGMLPFGNPWRVFGKIGYFDWEVEEDELYGGAPFSTKWSGSSTMYSLSIQFDIHEYADVRLEWERHDDIDMTYTEGYVDNYSAKIIWKFGRALKRYMSE
ncbi:MAG: hypothetical protein R3302_04965 [Sulfurimonadaceae bacterium]|nr:hypothetical protein [Sulfurimonadaceae bacterium]